MLHSVRIKAAQLLSPLVGTAPEILAEQFEIPKALDHGHLALPVFFLAKQMKKAPPLIAKEMVHAAELQKDADIEKLQPVGGYINIHFNNRYLQEELKKALLDQTEPFGTSQVGKGKKIIIEFSSPNVAKPMHVGHLRATVIGQALYNLACSQGYEVIGLNHLGDWGVQFGKLAWAYQQWGHEYDFVNDAFESLYALYVRFHNEAEKNPDIEKQGALTFRRLEEGDPEIRKLWRLFIDISLADYDRLWKMMGVRHDLVRGESFYSDRLKQTEKLIEEKGLLEESEGALVVRLDDEGMPPCIIRKSDGASLYATRDIASAIYRAEELRADENLYVVGMEQSLHFQQIIKVLDKMGYSWAKNFSHVGFGLYRFRDGKISSRTGNVIRLEDILTKSIEMVRDIIEEKNPELKDKETVARQVGVGAIIFNDLVNDRVKNVEFDWDKVTDFEGDSGPYVQYNVVRCKSLLRKLTAEMTSPEFPVVLSSEEERELLRRLMNYPSTVRMAFKNFKPHILATYLLDVCRSFGHFYHKHRILNLEDARLQQSRVALVYCTLQVLEKGLAHLNIECPAEM